MHKISGFGIDISACSMQCSLAWIWSTKPSSAGIAYFLCTRFCKLRGASMNQQLWSFGLRLDCLPLREAMESTLSAAFLAAVALLYLSSLAFGGVVTGC